MDLYQIADEQLADGDPRLQAALARAREAGVRPLCMCKTPGVEMYTAQIGEKLFIKRMPETGEHHAPECSHFEPPAQASGRAELAGMAILPQDDGSIALRLGFSLTKAKLAAGARSAKGQQPPPGTLKAGLQKLSLRGLLHLLFEESQFNRWRPNMAGKRNQGVLHRHMYRAAERILVQGVPLAQRLYVPEFFRPDHREEIAQRRRAHLAAAHKLVEDSGKAAMVVVVGELYAFENSFRGPQLLIKHMRDMPLGLADKLMAKVTKQHADVLAALDTDMAEPPRVIVAALVLQTNPGVYGVEAMTLMLATRQWLPARSLVDCELINALVAEQRTFLTPMAYDAKSTAPFASAMLLDAGDAGVELHAINPWATDEKEVQQKTALIGELAEAGRRPWVWDGNSDIPGFPPVRRQPAAAARPGSHQAPLENIRASTATPEEPWVPDGDFEGEEGAARGDAATDAGELSRDQAGAAPQASPRHGEHDADATPPWRIEDEDPVPAAGQTAAQPSEQEG